MTQPNAKLDPFAGSSRQGLPGEIDSGRFRRMASHVTDEDRAAFRKRIESIEERERNAQAALKEIQLQ